MIGRQPRWRHSADFEAESVVACRQPGVSIAAVAMSRSLNANLRRRLVVDAARARRLVPAERSEPEPSILGTAEAFVPVRPAPRAGGDVAIRIDLRRGSVATSLAPVMPQPETLAIWRGAAWLG